MSLDEETGKNFFRNVLDVWIYLEINKRFKEGKISKDTEVRKALIIMNPDNNTVEVKINDAVNAVVTSKYKAEVPKKYGEPVYENEIDEHLVVKGIDKDPNSAYTILIGVKNLWTIKFDGTWNKARARQRLDAAREFYEGATLCFNNRLLRPFIDNLYSAVELLVTSQLLLMADKTILESNHTHPPEHTLIQERIIQSIKIFTINYMV